MQFCDHRHWCTAQQWDAAATPAAVHRLPVFLHATSLLCLSCLSSIGMHAVRTQHMHGDRHRAEQAVQIVWDVCWDWRQGAGQVWSMTGRSSGRPFTTAASKLLDLAVYTYVLLTQCLGCKRPRHAVAQHSAVAAVDAQATPLRLLSSAPIFLCIARPRPDGITCLRMPSMPAYMLHGSAAKNGLRKFSGTSCGLSENWVTERIKQCSVQVHAAPAWTHSLSWLQHSLLLLPDYRT